MANISVEVPASVTTTLKHNGDQTVDLSGKSPEWWGYVAGFALRQAAGDADAGMKDEEPEKRAAAVKEKFDKLAAGEVPSGGGFSRLSDEDYAMKETLKGMGVKFDKGESLDAALDRLAENVADEGQDMAETRTALEAEIRGQELYKKTLAARKAKGKKAAAASGLLGKALGK